MSPNELNAIYAHLGAMFIILRHYGGVCCCISKRRVRGFWFVRVAGSNGGNRNFQ